MIQDERYVSLSTWKKDGSRKRTPVWIALLSEGWVGFTTGEKTWKVRRIQTNPSVELQPCNSKGQLVKDSKMLSGLARVVKLDAGQRGASISFLNESFSNPEGLVSLIRANPSSLKVKSGRLIIVRNWKEESKRIKELKYFLRKILNLIS